MSPDRSGCAAAGRRPGGMLAAMAPHIGRLLVLGAVVAAAVWIGRGIGQSEAVRLWVSRYGYGGVFLVGLLTGFNLAVPIPAIAFLPLFQEAGLRFGPTVLVIACGLTLADAVAFQVGRTSRAFVAGSRWLDRLERMREARPWAPLAALAVWAALMPLPNEVLVAPLGLMGYRLRQLFPFLLVGNIVFNLVAASGLAGLLRWIG